MTEARRKIEFGLEICYRISENYPEILKKYWGEDIVVDFVEWFKHAQEVAISKDINYISLMFNIEDLSDIDDALSSLKNILKVSKIPLIIKGTADKNIDKIFLPKLIEITNKPSIFAPIQDDNYKEIIEALLKSNVSGHRAILRTPIDINLTKELNILSIDCGLKKEDIIVDPDTGCIGYGIDYGYSIIERMIEAKKNGDDTLDTPIVVFSGYESYRAKEAKTHLDSAWGDNTIRSYAWEVSTTTALLYAGANMAILWHPNVVDSLKRGFSGLC